MRTRSIVALSFFASSALFAPACSGPVAPVDATTPDDVPRPDAALPDVARIDARIIDARTLDTPMLDTPMLDTPTLDTPTLDTPALDAPMDSAVPLPYIYGVLNDQLFRIDTTSAAITLVGATGITGDVYTDAEWDAAAGVAWIVTTPTAEPRLSTIDRCTGAITVGPRLTLGGTNLRQVEALTVDPVTGVLYLGVDENAGGGYLSEAFASVVPATGATTVIGYPATIQNDLDQLFWVGPTLWLLDDGRFYTLNPATGAATFAVTPVPEVLKVTRDDVAGVTFGTTRDDPRQLVEVDLATGALRTIGVTHTALEHGGELFEAVFAAPPCP